MYNYVETEHAPSLLYNFNSTVMRYILENIAEITNGTLYGNSKIEVETLLIDSRSLKFTKSVMFIALSGDSGNGHNI